MQVILVKRAVCSALAAGVAVTLVACGGGSSGASDATTSSTSTGTTTSTAQNGSVPLVVSDASSDDWATIGVTIVSIALIPQGGGTPVTVYTAPMPAPMVNLEELDQIAEILGNVTVPIGTYTGATLTLSGNPGDIALVVSADPESGFAGTPGATVPSNQIQIQHTAGATGSLTVPVNVNFVSPLVVTTSQNNALDLEFDLAHPAFLVAHTPVSTGTTLWAVNFDGPVRHHPVADIAHLVLRHTYGTVTAVASDSSSLTITKDFPTLPVVSPEVPVTSAISLQVLADATNGTIFYDLDAKTTTTVTSFASEASSLVGKYVRVAARYQENGTLVAVRVWASSTFNNVWLSPEGHVLHVNTGTDVMTVLNESGVGVPLTVNANTQFFFRTPASAVADATPIATGTAFLTSNNLVRGFKVHASVVDPLATPLVAQTIDIETAAYTGTISAANSTGFTDTRTFHTATDNYKVTLDYIASTTANGKDSSGNAVTGFKYWNFAYPTLVTSGANATTDFVAATNGGVNFGGTVGAVSAWGVSDAVWADPANSTGWSVPWTILLPTPIPLGTVATAYANNAFTMTVAGGASPATVDVSTTSGSATLVYQVDRTNNVLTISPIDVTTSSGLTSITNGLATGALVKVYGVPQANGTLQAYVLAYYTGTTMPSN
jgi:Domain of unknown function (DUF4382)/Domain of unknown function (DUF5666)